MSFPRTNGLQRPISRDEHEAAKRRLSPDSQTFVMLRWPDGTETKMLTGTVDGEDYHRRDGYPIRIEGFDWFGWPEGDPRSPARQEGK